MSGVTAINPATASAEFQFVHIPHYLIGQSIQNIYKNIIKKAYIIDSWQL